MKGPHTACFSRIKTASLAIYWSSSAAKQFKGIATVRHYALAMLLTGIP